MIAKHIGTACLLAAGCMVGLHAQTAQVERQTSIKVKDGKQVTMTGCVERSASGDEYMLTHVADKSGARHAYLLVSDDQDELAKNVGHLVQVEGKAADRGNAKVETRTETKVKVENRQNSTMKSTSEVSGDLDGLPLLGVQSVKTIAAACR